MSNPLRCPEFGLSRLRRHLPAPSFSTPRFLDILTYRKGVASKISFRYNPCILNFRFSINASPRHNPFKLHLMVSALGLQFIYIINASPRHNPFKFHLMASALGLQFILRYRATYLAITKYLLTLQKATGSLITRVIILSSPFTNW